MATTNFLRMWKDGDRVFVNVNGATIEVHSFTVDDGTVTLQFHARVAPMKPEDDEGEKDPERASALATRRARVSQRST